MAFVELEDAVFDLKRRMLVATWMVVSKRGVVDGVAYIVGLLGSVLPCQKNALRQMNKICKIL